MKTAKITYSFAVGLLSLGLVSAPMGQPLVRAAGLPKASYRSQSYGKAKPAGSLWKPKQKDLSIPASQVIVEFSTSSDAKQEAVADKFDAETALEVTPKTVVLDLPDSANVQAIADKLANEKDVVNAEPDYRSVALAQKTSWGYDTIHAAQALADNSADGDGIVVAVVDTGVDYTHNELSPKITSNGAETPSNGIDDDSNGFTDDVIGWDFAGAFAGVSSQDNDPMDEYGHGTHVAGIVAADNDSDGVVGVAPGASIMPIKVLDDSGYGTNSSIAAGIRYAVDNGADVINMSLGGPAPSSTLKSAIDYAEANDVVVVAAAGNEYGWNAYSSYPAAYSNVISVAASDTNDKLAAFSNWGKVEVTAPGVDILSTVPGDRTAKYSGTSMASPFVAGNVALIKDKHPGYSAAKLRHTLLTTSQDQGEASRDLRYGSGLIDADVATSTLSNSIELESSSWRIISNDGQFDGGSATISTRLLDSTGVAQNGETVNFTTTKGELSASSAVTNSEGVASVTLTADNIQGMAKVTATHGYGAKSIQVLLLNNNIEAHELRLYNTGQQLNPDDTPYIEDTKFHGGTELTAVLELRNRQLAYIDTVGNLTTDISYQVTDSEDVAVAGLSGELTNKTVEPNNSFIEIPMTLPMDIDDGTYQLDAVVTDLESSKTSEINYTFQVGGTKDLLVVPLNDVTVDVYNSDYGSVSMQSLQPIMSSLNNLDESYDVWPFVDASASDENLDRLREYPAVIFVGGSPYTDDVVENYLASGGNAYLSGNTDFPTALGAGLDITGWCGGSGATNTTLSYDCEGQKMEPTEIDGTEGGLFDGKTYNISAYNFNSTGAQDNLVSDELNGDDTTVDQLVYADGGQNSPAIAGFSRDDGFSRFVMTGFGVAAVDDQGDGREDFVQTILDYLRPTGDFAVDDVINGDPVTGEAKTITVTGNSFEATGNTTVTIGDQPASDVTVLDRNTLTAVTPTNLGVGTYDVTVTSPFGEEVTIADGVTVTYRKPALDSIKEYFGANDTPRTITLYGKYFRSGATVKLNGKKLGGVKVSSKKITAVVPKDFAVGTHAVLVTNSDGKKDSTGDRYRVRYGFRSNLSLGSYSGEVKKLESRLISEGYLSKSNGANNYFGTATRTALKRMQRNNGLPQTGKLDSATRKKINTTWNLK